ncbi:MULTISPECIES: anti-sigma-E factor RseA [Serratia]|jgi:sigma-E factor negative regulatory protein RseA|uniref:Anti-sigma-E factor RseA n=1 Tax=Serratia liquefaciens TaxID=614 RepID=A0A515CR64_SERLI|nr:MULTISPECIES: anti-sigma-E factor RseA [Serratia]MBH2813044.1 anti-sigma-E factor RseA [Serratia liquefaciens]MBI6162565.1 anti-sigma-E factor RseA [Serratia liquefaciens]MBV0844379.1 anti-sigma-E factor RseA [Serratia liquefaciens]MCS4318194.1 sigma-E factor negative regulatory protein RseA [Serratia sp. BIGb0234]MDU4173580.1 anti-sigma-E factor RseA [Serratia liquefaciens]
MQKEKLSALMDGESLDSELLSSLSKDRALQQSWQSYHLIRDTLRGDIGQVMHFDIADRVAAALEKEPARLVPSAVPESQPQPHTWQKMPFWDKVRPWASQITQIGMAACVSLAVIVGVQQYNQPAEQSAAAESPAFTTLPIMGQASPVSLGVPADSFSTGSGQQQQVQEQRKRINAMLQDYELQRRLHSDQLQLEQSTPQQAAVQVPGTQSLGMQQQ